LFNPSIGKFNFLPPIKIPVLKNYYTLVYDRFSNNHRIIALSETYHYYYSKKLVVNVHNLGTDSWRKIQDLYQLNLTNVN
jgi:hypothetical protein